MLCFNHARKLEAVTSGNTLTCMHGFIALEYDICENVTEAWTRYFINEKKERDDGQDRCL